MKWQGITTIWKKSLKNNPRGVYKSYPLHWTEKTALESDGEQSRGIQIHGLIPLSETKKTALKMNETGRNDGHIRKQNKMTKREDLHGNGDCGKIELKLTFEGKICS